jgi:hypothetical protein
MQAYSVLKYFVAPSANPSDCINSHAASARNYGAGATIKLKELAAARLVNKFFTRT